MAGPADECALCAQPYLEPSDTPSGVCGNGASSL